MKRKTKLPHLTLHDLISAISYWGSATRVLLITFIALAVSFIRFLEFEASSNLPISEFLMSEGQMLVYVIGSFLILDVGYVIISRAYTFKKRYDKSILLTLELLLALSYFVPYLAVVPERVAIVTQWVFVAVLFVLSFRLLLGFLYGKRAKN